MFDDIIASWMIIVVYFSCVFSHGHSIGRRPGQQSVSSAPLFAGGHDACVKQSSGAQGGRAVGLLVQRCPAPGDQLRRSDGEDLGDGAWRGSAGEQQDCSRQRTSHRAGPGHREGGLNELIGTSGITERSRFIC